MTNETTMLKALMNGAKINPKFQPQNNKQAYLAYLCGLEVSLPEPRTVEEALLCKLCAVGISGKGQYLHFMSAEASFAPFTMILINNDPKSLSRTYIEKTDALNGATIIFRGDDMGGADDFYATVVGYDYDKGNHEGNIVLDREFILPIGPQPNVIDVRSGGVTDIVVLL